MESLALVQAQSLHCNFSVPVLLLPVGDVPPDVLAAYVQAFAQYTVVQLRDATPPGDYSRDRSAFKFLSWSVAHACAELDFCLFCSWFWLRRIDRCWVLVGLMRVCLYLCHSVFVLLSVPLSVSFCLCLFVSLCLCVSVSLCVCLRSNGRVNFRYQLRPGLPHHYQPAPRGRHADAALHHAGMSLSACR